MMEYHLIDNSNRDGLSVGTCFVSISLIKTTFNEGRDFGDHGALGQFLLVRAQILPASRSHQNLGKI